MHVVVGEEGNATGDERHDGASKARLAREGGGLLLAAEVPRKEARKRRRQESCLYKGCVYELTRGVMRTRMQAPTRTVGEIG